MCKRHGHQVGLEAKIEYHPTFDVIGVNYESWRRYDDKHLRHRGQ